MTQTVCVSVISVNIVVVAVMGLSRSSSNRLSSISFSNAPWWRFADLRPWGLAEAARDARRTRGAMWTMVRALGEPED